jgi:hypothetical protein
VGKVEHPGRYASGGDGDASIFLVFIAVLIVVPAVGWTFVLAWRLLVTGLPRVFISRCEWTSSVLVFYCAGLRPRFLSVARRFAVATD